MKPGASVFFRSSVIGAKMSVRLNFRSCSPSPTLSPLTSLDLRCLIVFETAPPSPNVSSTDLSVASDFLSYSFFLIICLSGSLILFSSASINSSAFFDQPCSSHIASTLLLGSPACRFARPESLDLRYLFFPRHHWLAVRFHFSVLLQFLVVLV